MIYLALVLISAAVGTLAFIVWLAVDEAMGADADYLKERIATLTKDLAVITQSYKDADRCAVKFSSEVYALERENEALKAKIAILEGE